MFTIGYELGRTSEDISNEPDIEKTYKLRKINSYHSQNEPFVFWFNARRFYLSRRVIAVEKVTNTKDERQVSFPKNIFLIFLVVCS